MNTPVAAKMMTIPFALARDFLSRGASKLPTVNAGAHAGTAIGLDHPQAALCTSACVIGACALFLLVDLSYPLVLWVESRLAVNAIEMY